MGEMIVAASEIPLPSLSWQPVSGSEGERKNKRAIEREEKFILIFVCYAFTEFVGIYANNRCSSHASFSPSTTVNVRKCGRPSRGPVKLWAASKRVQTGPALA